MKIGQTIKRIRDEKRAGVFVAAVATVDWIYNSNQTAPGAIALFGGLGIFCLLFGLLTRSRQ